ncbi:MAG: winged helix-turn-helix transcriptional regulator [Clostridia bacterium]|nr:winged helix-turn-helix transcriptional regulator [Clostridia bacterium]
MSEKPHHIGQCRPDFDKLTEGMLFNDISRLFNGRVRRETERLGFPQGYRRIVFHLSHNECLTQNELVKLTHMKAPSISVQLQKMEQEKLITRKTDEKDMRKSYIYLTEKGRECEKLFISKCQETEKVMFENFSEDEMKILKEYLKRITNNLIGEMEESR